MTESGSDKIKDVEYFESLLGYIKNIIVGHESSLKLIENGKEIPAHKKMQSTKDKLYAIASNLSYKIKNSDNKNEKDNN